MIKLLKYLSNKYLIHFQLSDEGYFWETEDEELLKERFHQYNTLLDAVTFALENFPMKEHENFESYFLRVLKHKKGDNGNVNND